ncbi:gram-negative bacteria-binding protein 2-like [Teleopsis dalmanni]|nr:gram-negative bacteria-binding protein 2-like [Teleopsis dalmanni]XP_037940760.1 gram-negative bacteria-binding protein 2-like [Teleopsis dalmanni]
MRFRIYFLVVYGFIEIYAYTMPEIVLDLKHTGFQISVPDKAGITEVVYVIEINDICSTIMDYLSKPQDNMWSARQQNITLNNHDRVSVTLMIVHNDSIYLNTENFRIENSKPKKVITSNIKKNSIEDFIPECVTAHTNNQNCRKPQTTSTTAIVNCIDDLIFEENFDNTDEVNLSRWSYDIYNKNSDNRSVEFVLFDNSKKNCFVSDGCLNIVPTVTEKIRAQPIDLRKK